MTLKIWHPFTQHATESDPVVLVKGKGVLLYDEHGKSYIDAISSWWTTLHGHSHPRLNEALRRQAETLEHTMFSGFSHLPALTLAELLAQATDQAFSHLFFSDNGSTAVEVALKISLQYWSNQRQKKRSLFLAFEGGYHGDTFGAMAVGRGSSFFEAFEEVLPEVVLVPYPATWDGDNDVDLKEEKAFSYLKEVVEQRYGEIASVIIEPLVQGAGGMRMCRPEFVKAITTYLQEKGILVIFDEVAVGFGRTGTLFAYQQCGIVPDLLCLAKGLTGGYMPMSVTLCHDRIYEAFLGKSFSKALAHGHSFTANPLACAVAVESLTMLLEEEVRCKIQGIQTFYQDVKPVLKQSGQYDHIRSRGTILAMDHHDPRYHVYKSPLSEKWKSFFKEQGVNLRPLGGTIYILPPYDIQTEQLMTVIETLLFEG